MRNVKNLTVVVILIMVPLLGFTTLSGSAFAAMLGDVVVDGETKSFDSDDVIDNLAVINGGRALLDGTTIEGNITIEGEDSYANFFYVSVGGNAIVKDDAMLSMWYSTIGGNLQGDSFYHINFLISDVVGSIQMTGGGAFNGAYGPCTVGGDIQYEKGNAVLLNWFTVGGNVQVSDNDGAGSGFITVKNCEIDGDLQVCDNENMYGVLGTNKEITIQDNTVGGNLQVKDNTPTPTVSGNDVEGNVELD